MTTLQILGVVKEVDPLCNAEPPEAAAYQSIVSPAPGVAEIFTVPVPHLEPPVPAGATGKAFMVATTAVLVAEKQAVVVFLDCA